MCNTCNDEGGWYIRESTRWAPAETYLPSEVKQLGIDPPGEFRECPRCKGAPVEKEEDDE